MPQTKIVFIHGFTQTAKSYATFKKNYGKLWETAELPGHGKAKPLSSEETGKAAVARLVKKYKRAVYGGYSMGARLAMRTALEYPGVTAGLILVSATAGIRDPKERESRRLSDEMLAKRIRHSEPEEFLREWLSLPMFADLSPEQANVEARLAYDRNNLADTLLKLSPGVEEPMWELLPLLSLHAIPVLILAGAKDKKYCKIAYELKDVIGDLAELHIIENCGHAVLAEKPDEALAHIKLFTAKCR
ncbi:MAG: alpha/beta fold hydrolase [Firmicutes bacterium]|nr:alpha/beta fold hydrolase [Bacillota bacterium]